MTSIRDIARLSGFSVSTVSRVLNDHPYVSAEKRAHIQKIIKELDYTVNQNAVNLSIGKTKTIGIILPYATNPGFDKIIQGILTTAIKHKYNLMLLPTNYSKDEEIKHLNLLKNKRVDGIIITSKANSWDVLNDYAKYGSIVTCEETPLQTISAAYTDRLRSYLEVFHYLKKRGHTNVAFTSVRSAEKSNSTKSVLVAYEQVFAPPLEKNYRTNCFTYEDGLRAGEYFLNQANPPTAIYANGDEIAAGIYHVAIEKGLRIPNDLVLIGEEYLPVGKVLELSSMDHQLELLGQVAFELAIQQRIKKKKIPHILRCAPN